jgi:transglutaminase-like putative cysteine protease
MSPALQKNILDFFEQNSCKLEVKPEYLAATPLCNLHHLHLVELQKELVGNLGEPEKITQRIYNFLREKILYEFDLWPVSAAETLQKGTGMCFNKSNLMVALLRASGVPAVYSLVWIAKGGFSFTTEEGMFRKIQPRTVHAYVEAYLGEKKGWRRYVDTSLDTRLRQVLQKQGYEPFQNILTDLPIERFATAEEVIEWRKKYKESMGVEDSITRPEMEKSNEKMRALREQSSQ